MSLQAYVTKASWERNKGCRPPSFCNTNITQMDYNELKEIIKYVKKTVPCGYCNKKFTDEGIKLVSQMGNDLLFHFSCDHCGNQLMIHVTLSEHEQNPNRLKINTHNHPMISHDEVLDIHNFLNKFNGDFRSLFYINKK